MANTSSADPGAKRSIYVRGCSADLVARLDQFAAENQLSRTQAVKFLVNKALQHEGFGVGLPAERGSDAA